MAWSPDDRGLGILMVGPEDVLGPFRDIVDSQHVARVLGFPIKDYHSTKSVDAITQLNVSDDDSAMSASSQQMSLAALCGCMRSMLWYILAPQLQCGGQGGLR